jgi:uncharacterized protein (TIRG00374 family)
MTKTQKKVTWIFLQIVVTLFFLYLTFHNTNFKTLRASLYAINYWLLSFTLMPLLATFFLLAAREKYLLLHMHKFHEYDLLRGVTLGFVGNNVLPFRGGEFLKVLYWSRVSSRSYVSLLSVALIERLLDLGCLIFLFFIGTKSVLIKLGIDIQWVIALFVLVLLPLMILIFLDWKYKKEFALHQSIHYFLGDRISHWINHAISQVMQGIRVLGNLKNIVSALFFTIIYWAMNLICIAVMLKAFHIVVPWQAVIVLALATSFGTAIPAAPGYIGTFDYFSKMALVLFGVPASLAASFAIVSHIVLMVPLTLVGIIFVYPILGRLGKAK